MKRLIEFFRFGEVFYYFIRVFKKHDQKYPINFNIKVMHGINRISIVLFLICLIVILIRRIF